MAEELRIRVIFETGEAKKGAEDLAKAGEVASNSLAGMQKRVNELQKAFLNARDGTREQIKAYQDYQNAVTQLGASQLRLNSALSNSTRTSASMTMALQSMNFTIRDSPYFFRDFSLGILAIGNNLNPLIDNLIRVKQEAKLVGSSLGSQLKTALMGTNGVIFAFSVLVSVLQAVVFAMSGTKDEAKKTTEEIEDLTSALEKMSRKELVKTKVIASEEVDFYQKLAERRLKELAESEASGGTGILNEGTRKVAEELLRIWKEQGQGLKGLNDEEKTRLSNAKTQLAYAQILLNSHISLRDINNQIRELQEKKLTATASESKLLDQQITNLEQLKKDYFLVEKSREKTKKQKDYIVTTERLNKEIEELQVLKEQTDNLRNRSLYEELINQRIRERDSFQGRVEGVGGLQEFMQYGLDGEPVGANPNSFFDKLLGWKSKEDLDKELEETRKEMQLINTLSSQVGNSLFQAFIQGKLGADELLKSLLAIVGQLVFIEGLKYIFSGGVLGLFGKGAQATGSAGGGFLPSMIFPSNTNIPSPKLTLGKITTADNSFSSLINSFNSGNFISQKGLNKLEIELIGEVVESKNNFHTRVRKAEVYNNVNKGMGTIGRS